MYAYKEIQKLKRAEYKWSALVGAYVGLGDYAARGVPARFLDGKAERPKAVEVGGGHGSGSGSTGDGVVSTEQKKPVSADVNVQVGGNSTASANTL